MANPFPTAPGTAAVPTGINDHITATTATEDAQSSLLRLTRRHSLPTSATLTHFLSLWNNEEGGGHSAPIVTQQDCRASGVASTAQIQHLRSASVSLGDRKSQQVAALTGNRHRYGHRHTHSAAVDQPVIVKSYNPKPNNGAMGSTVPEDDELEKVPLPPIDAFSFDGILKTIEPQVNHAVDSISKLCYRYQDSLQSEVDLLTETQSTIDSQMKEADHLATQVLKTTKLRTERLDAETAGLKGGAAVEVVAEAAEATHTFITSIIATLLAIDEMLPPPDRLAPTNSPHRKHYPRLHTLLNDKSTELSIRFGSARLFAPQESPDQSRPTTAPLSGMNFGESASGANGGRTDTWVLGRRMSITSSRTVTSFSHNRRISSPPKLQLRTLLPTSPPENISNRSSNPRTASSQGSILPLPAQTETAVSLATPVSTSTHASSGSKRDSEGWNRRVSTSTLNFLPIKETETSPKEEKKGLWRRSSSWSIGGLWGRGEERKEGAEEKLRKMLEVESKARGGKGKGKGKGKGRMV
ncbi:hypothetical protein RUND412_009990 [Rhizina undulata]